MTRIALIGPNSIEYVDNILKIWENKSSVVLINENISYEKVLKLLDETSAYKCLVDDKVLKKWQNYDINYDLFEPYHSGDSIVLPSHLYDKYKENYSFEEAVVIYSSGTTGNAKGIRLSHYAISNNANGIIDAMDINNNDCIYIIKSLTHSSTFTGELLVGLKKKIKLIISKNVILPRVVIENIVKYNVTIMVITPYILNLLCKNCELSGEKFLPLKKVYTCGEQLSAKLKHLACKIFKGTNIYNAYGLTEAGPRVAMQNPNFNTSNSVGIALNNVRIKILNESEEEVKKNQKGIIHIQTNSLYSGYVTGKLKSKTLLEGWFNTGDIGYFDNNGELYICGRIDDMIIINSLKIYPNDIESIIIKNTQIEKCKILKIKIEEDEFLGCAYEGHKLNEIDIIKKIKNELLPHEIPKVYINLNALPLNYNGKVNIDEIIKIFNKRIKEDNE